MTTYATDLEPIGITLNTIPPALERLTKVADLDYYKGSLVSLFTDPENADLYIYKWCEAGEVHNRWLVFRTTYGQLMQFMRLETSFLDFVKSAPDRVYYLLDIRVDDLLNVYHEYTYQVNLAELPDEYLPSPHRTYANFHPLESSVPVIEGFIVQNLSDFNQATYWQELQITQKCTKEEYLTLLNSLIPDYHLDSLVFDPKLILTWKKRYIDELQMLAYKLYLIEKYSTAKRLIESFIDDFKIMEGESSIHYLQLVSNYAIILISADRSNCYQAKELFEEVLDQLEESNNQAHPLFSVTQKNLEILNKEHFSVNELQPYFSYAA